MVEQLTIFEKHIDVKATMERVINFFRKYPHLKRIARRAQINNTGISSPSFDGMPKGTNNGNSVERRLVQSIYARQVVEEVPQAISCCDTISQKVIKGLFFEGMSNQEVYESIGYEKSQYNEKIKPRALLQFAEAYLLDDLKVYKSDTHR